MFLQFTKMFMKEPHTALFVAPTGVGKMHLALNLLENEYRNHFDFIIIICPMLEHNETYKSRGWVWNDPDVIPIELDNNLYYLIEKISKVLAGSKTLFLINDIIADEALDKCCQPLLELAISGRHRAHSNLNVSEYFSNPQTCQCKESKFCYEPHGHVITGDLMVIENAKLRELVAKGPKYREPNRVNWKATETMFLESIDLYAKIGPCDNCVQEILY